MSNNTDMEYDEDRAISHIRACLPAGLKEKYTDDEILNVIDMIWDFYDDNGLLDLDDDGNAEPDTEALAAYVAKMLKKDKDSTVAIEDIDPIIMGELDYERSIGLEE